MNYHYLIKAPMKKSSAKSALISFVIILGAVGSIVTLSLNSAPICLEIMAVNKRWRTYAHVERFQVVNESVPQTSNNNESALPVDAYNIEYRVESDCNT